jgi:catechol 2,3-dioxygenase-like lactoylglutathione lyase family enzyme
MLSHVHVGVADFNRAFDFYSSVLPVLGLALKFSEPEKGWAGWMTPGVARPLFLVGRAFDGRPASPGNGQMLALLAPDRAAVDRCHAVALANGGRSEGAPGMRPQYHADYYGAYFRDPDGNKLCVCCHQPEPGR